MLQLMKDLPENVVGVHALGNVTKDDYEQVFVPAIEKVAKQYGEINLLMLLETDLGNFTYGAWMQDAKMSLKNFGKWNKMALVTDQKTVEKVFNVFNFVSPAEAKGFSVADVALAKAWVAAPDEVTDKK